MLEQVKLRLENILTDYDSVEAIKVSLGKVVKDIQDYQKSSATLSDVHNALRTLEQYDTMYNMELERYNAMDRKNNKECSYQVQEMICILALMGSLLTNTLRKYTMMEDKSVMAKYLRRLNEINEYVRSEKIMWQSVLKSLTTLIRADLEDREYAQVSED